MNANKWCKKWAFSSGKCAKEQETIEAGMSKAAAWGQCCMRKSDYNTLTFLIQDSTQFQVKTLWWWSDGPHWITLVVAWNGVHWEGTLGSEHTHCPLSTSRPETAVLTRTDTSVGGALPSWSLHQFKMVGTAVLDNSRGKDQTSKVLHLPLTFPSFGVVLSHHPVVPIWMSLTWQPKVTVKLVQTGRLATSFKLTLSR